MQTCKEGLKSPQEVLWNRRTSCTTHTLLSLPTRLGSTCHLAYSALLFQFSPAMRGWSLLRRSSGIGAPAAKYQNQSEWCLKSYIFTLHISQGSRSPARRDWSLWTKSSGMGVPAAHTKKTEFLRLIIKQSQLQRFWFAICIH